jgi:hypothetical protein
MKLVLLLLLLFPTVCSAQLVFEVNAPSNERGVFPCMAGVTSDWPNSPDLYQNGNWFSDTLILVDDGTLGSACNALNNSVVSNFALVYRSGCSLGQSLLNAQNAGATAAIVIDSVDGRPLPFDPDALSSSITIPFVIISRGKGDSLIQRMAENEIVVASFGDKTGVNTTDLGMYKEFSLWSRYGIFPFGQYFLPDNHFGTWVYNHGITDASNVQVKLWFYHDPAYPMHNQEVLSALFDVIAGDSVFINFDFDYDHVDFGYAITKNNPLKYGYEIMNTVDDDTLDNTISQLVYGDDEIISNTFDGNYPSNPDFSEVDYFIEGSADGFDPIAYCLYFPIKITSTDAVLCEPIFPMALGQPGAEQVVRMYRVDIVPQGAAFYDLGGDGYYYFEIQPDSFYCNPPFFSTIKCSQNADIVTAILTTGSGKLGFSSDMYNDEQIRQGYIPTYFRKNMLTQDSLYEPQFMITPIITFNMTPNGVCYYNDLPETESPPISLFPNPAMSALTIQSEEIIETITVFDVFGKKVLSIEAGGNLEQTLDVKALHSGTYLVEVVGEGRSVGRFVKE